MPLSSTVVFLPTGRRGLSFLSQESPPSSLFWVVVIGIVPEKIAVEIVVAAEIPVVVPVAVAAAGDRAGRFHKVSKDSCCRYTVGRVVTRDDDDEGCGIANNYAIVEGGCDGDRVFVCGCLCFGLQCYLTRVVLGSWYDMCT
jgi:hypothetical protein